MMMRAEATLRMASLAFVLAAVAGCSEIQTDRDVDREIGPLAQESWDVSLQISEDGVIRIQLDAAHMIRYDDPDSVLTIFDADSSGGTVTATFYDSLGSETGVVTAHKVLFDQHDKAMIASGDVLIESSNGRTLRTERVFWFEDAGRIEAPGFVSFTTEDQNITGYEMEATEDLDEWSIRRVSGTVTIRPE